MQTIQHFKEGKEQLYYLGKTLRQRYNNLVDIEYNPSNIYCQSSSVDRTIESARQFLNGFYAKSNENWTINYQPNVVVPIDIIPSEFDNLLIMHRYCRKYEIAFRKYISSKEFKKMESKYRNLYSYLKKYTGKSVNSFNKIRNLYSTLSIENYHNKT